MTKPTITDEDRKAAHSILWVQTLIDDQEVIAEAFAAHRQAAFNAGLERAAVILEEDAKLCDCFARAEGECACGAWDDYKTAPIERMVDLIRAEKDKT